MALTKLGDLEIGSIVTVNENGKPAEFIVSKHDYESGLNGTGRTLLVRKYSKGNRVWGNGEDDYYPECSVDNWLNDTYLNSLDDDVKGVIGTTAFLWYDEHRERKMLTLSRAVFMLSVAEYGMTSGFAKAGEGTVLPNASDLRRLYSASGNEVSHWSRSQQLGGSYMACYIQMATSNDPLRVSYRTTDYSLAVRPAFTMPASLYRGEDGALIVNALPEISSGVPSGSDLGTKNESVSLSYAVTDMEGDAVTVREYLDGALLNTKPVVLEQTNEIRIEGVDYQKITNGVHTLSIVANDGKNDGPEYTVTFSKKVTTASVTLEHPLTADDAIQVAVATIVGSLPDDAEITIELTNNANDAEPVWENATAAILAGENYVFVNNTASAGFAFNFKVTVSRGDSDVGGYISSIGGAFQ